MIAKEEQEVKIEIGYDLEGIYTDAYVGEVERDILVEFLEQEEWGVGFLATIESFLFRIFNNDLGNEIKAISAPEDDLEFYSQGAGARKTFDFGAALKRPLPNNYAEIKEYFSAQPTPDLAFQRYMELCAKAVKHNNDLTLFTALSNEFWKDWKHTSGQQKAEARDAAGKPYYIKVKDNHAVVFFPEEKIGNKNSALLYFMFLSDTGWQVDVAMMTRCLRVVGPGWTIMTDIFHVYSEIISEEYNIYGGFLVPWNSQAGIVPYRLNYDTYGKDTIPGYKSIKPNFPIRVSWNYEGQIGLRTGDILLSVDGKKIQNKKDFFKLHDYDAVFGKEYTFEVMRDGKKLFVKEELDPFPDGFEKFRHCLIVPRRWLGVYMVQSLDKEWNVTRRLRDRGKFRYSSLCEIIDIFPGSPADRAGLKVRDLIVDYGVPDDNGEIMPYDVIKALYNKKPGESITFTIVRDLKDVLKITVTPEETMHQGYF